MKIIKKIVAGLLISISLLVNISLVNALDLSSIDLNINTREVPQDNFIYDLISQDKSVEFIPWERKLISTDLISKNGINYNHNIFLIGQNKATFINKYNYIKSISYINFDEEKTFDYKNDSLLAYNKYIDNQNKLEDIVNNNNGKYSFVSTYIENKELNKDYKKYISLNDDDKKIANDYVVSLYGTNELVSYNKENQYKTRDKKTYTSVLYNNGDIQNNLNSSINNLTNKNASVIDSKIENVYNTDLDTKETLPREIFESKEQANIRVNELNVINGTYKIVSNVTSDSIYDKTISKDINNNYDNMISLSNYVDELRNDGYNVTSLIIKENKSLVNHSINEEVKNLNNATDMKNEFNEKYNAEATITELPDETDSETKALNTKILYTEEEAIDYKNELENNSYYVSNYMVTKTTEYYKNNVEVDNGISNGNVTDQNRVNVFLRRDNNVQYENGSTSYDVGDYLYIGAVGVNTPETVFDINADSQNNNIEYLINNNNNIGTKVINSLKNNVVRNNLARYGINFDPNKQVLVFYVLKNTEDDKVNNRKYPNGKGGTVKVNLPSCKYHIDAVIRNLSDIKDIVITKYNVSGQKQLLTPKDMFFVNGSETTFGSKYLVSGSIDTLDANGTYNLSGTVNKDIYKDVYYVDGVKTTFGYQQRYIINYTEPELDGYLLTVKSNRLTYYVSTSGEGFYNNYSIKEDINYEYEDVFEDIYNEVIEELPPYTGITSDYNFYISMACLVSLLGLLNKKKISE